MLQEQELDALCNAELAEIPSPSKLSSTTAWGEDSFFATLGNILDDDDIDQAEGYYTKMPETFISRTGTPIKTSPATGSRTTSLKRQRPEIDLADDSDHVRNPPDANPGKVPCSLLLAASLPLRVE